MKSSHDDGVGDSGLRSRFADAAPLEGGLTNDVRLTDDGTVIKEFSADPPLAHLLRTYTIGQGAAEDVAATPVDAAAAYLEDTDPLTMAEDAYDLAQDQHEPITQESRMAAEEEAEAILDELGIRTPEIMDRDGALMEYEAIDGQDLPEYWAEADAETAYETAERFGDQLRAMHDAGLARRDNRPENTLVEDGDLVYIDHEYATTDADPADMTADVITFVSGIRQLDPDTYETVRAGFEDGYGEDIGTIEDLASPGTSVGHAVIEEAKELRDGYHKRAADDDTLTAVRDTIDAAREKQYERVRNAVRNLI